MKKELSDIEKNRLLTLLRQKERDKIPPILAPLWKPYRKKMIHGGRGSAKTQTVIRIKIRQASIKRHRVIWAREIFGSIEDSIYDEIVILLDKLKYPGWEIQNTKIVNKRTGSKFIFKGLRDLKATRSLKGLAHYDSIVVDEAEGVLMDSWDLIVPTFREMNSEIWAIFNRYEELDPVYQKFCINPDPDTLVIECNWRDNPFFPEVLRKEKDIDFKNDRDKALHIWENHPIAQLEFAIFTRAIVDAATKRDCKEDGPQVLGVDVGRFGDDPTKVYERRGSSCIKLFERKMEAPIKTAREIAARADSKYTLMNIDNGGLGGGGMIDALEDLGYKNITSINFGGTAKNDKEYANVSTEMHFECKDKLQFASIPNDIKLRQDLTGRLFGYDKKIRKRIEDKEAFRKRYHRSPDDGDAVVLCFYDSGKRLIIPDIDRRNLKEKVKQRIAKIKRRFIS